MGPLLTILPPSSVGIFKPIALVLAVFKTLKTGSKPVILFVPENMIGVTPSTGLTSAGLPGLPGI